MEVKKIGAIDIGSNAVRLLIKTLYISENQTTFNKTSLVRVPIRLGRDVFTAGKISALNIHRLIDTMKSYSLLMNVHGVDVYKALATSAMREAENGEAVADMIKEKSGIDIQIIDGEKEAEILFKTELNSYLKKGGNYLYVDVGGGSTELSFFVDGKLELSKSFSVGTVRLIEGKVDEKHYKEDMKKWVKKNTKDNKFSIIGSGGNINYAFKFSKKSYGTPLSYELLQSIKKEFSKYSYEERLEKLNMKLDRADVIDGALDIYLNIMKWSKSEFIHVPKIGLADGIVQTLYHEYYTDKTNKNATVS